MRHVLVNGTPIRGTSSSSTCSTSAPASSPRSREASRSSLKVKPEGQGGVAVTTTAQIYSCDDHLDLCDGAARRLGVAAVARRRADAARASSSATASSMWVCEDRVLGRSGGAGRNPRREEAQRDQARRHRGRRLPRRQRRAAARGHGPRRPGGVGDLRAARDRVADRATPRSSRRASPPGTTGPPRSSTSRPTGSPCSRFLPLHSPEAAAAELERCAGLGHRGAIIDVFEFDLPTGRGTASGRPARRPACRSASTSGRRRGQALSYKIGKWQAAAFATHHAAAARRAARDDDLLGRARASPAAAAGAGRVGHRLAAVLRRARRTEWSSLTRQARLRARSCRRASCSAARCTRRSRRSAFGPRADPAAGCRSCMWASDYPHTDSTFPHSLDAIEERSACSRPRTFRRSRRQTPRSCTSSR